MLLLLIVEWALSIGRYVPIDDVVVVGYWTLLLIVPIDDAIVVAVAGG